MRGYKTINSENIDFLPWVSLFSVEQKKRDPGTR